MLNVYQCMVFPRDAGSSSFKVEIRAENSHVAQQMAEAQYAGPNVTVTTWLLEQNM